MHKKDYVWNSATGSCGNGKYLGSITDDLVIMCNEIIKETKTIPSKTVLIKSTSTNFDILPAFLLLAIELLIAVSIYLIKHRSKQKTFIVKSYHK